MLASPDAFAYNANENHYHQRIFPVPIFMLDRYYDELPRFPAKSGYGRDEASNPAQEAFLHIPARHDVFEGSGNDDVNAGELAAVDTATTEAEDASRWCVFTIRSASETLPPRCRNAFELGKPDGMLQAVIARQIGISRDILEREYCRDEMDRPSALSFFHSTSPETRATRSAQAVTPNHQ